MVGGLSTRYVVLLHLSLVLVTWPLAVRRWSLAIHSRFHFGVPQRRSPWRRKWGFAFLEPIRSFDFIAMICFHRQRPPFDLCLCMDVIEHVPDYIEFTKSLRSKEHYKLFHIPLDISALSVLRGWPLLRSRKTVGHIQYFFKDTALATLSDAGYQIVDWFYTSGVVDHPPTTKAKILRLPRLLLFRLSRDLAVRLLGGYSIMVLAR